MATKITERLKRKYYYPIQFANLFDTMLWALCMLCLQSHVKAIITMFAWIFESQLGSNLCVFGLI